MIRQRHSGVVVILSALFFLLYSEERETEPDSVLSTGPDSVSEAENPGKGIAEAGYDTLAGDLPSVLFPGSRPYIVISDIYVPEGEKVSIQAGSILIFKEFTGLYVSGKLEINGEPESPVVFTSVNDSEYIKHDAPAPAPYDWNGIHISKSGVGADIEYASISYAVEGLVSETRFFRLKPCIFLSNGRVDLRIEGEDKEVQNGEPFEYALSVTDPELQDVPKEYLRDPDEVKRNLMRYTSIGAGVAGTVLSILYISRMGESLDRHKKLSSTDPENLSDNSSAEWEKSRSDKNSDVAGFVAGLSLLSAGGVFFGVSFTF